MECKRCLTQRSEDFFLGSKGYYCRRCITYGRVMVNDEPQIIAYDSENIDSEYLLPFTLTVNQQVIASKIMDLYQLGNGLLHAVCGSGKTELVLQTISLALKHNLTVGWAIPRRSVVLQLSQRLQQYFAQLKVVAVCGGYTSDTLGDLIVCTTHQLYRYYQYFDWLIIDEADAYPFADDEVLRSIAKTSCRGTYLYMSATLLPWMEQVDYRLSLNQRPHGHNLPVPRELRSYQWMMLIKLYQLLSTSQQPTLVFFPTIKQVKQFSKILNHQGVWAGHPLLDQTVQQLIDGQLQILFCTSVLERGITIENVKVIVYQADHGIFTTGALIQMAGRVGRSSRYPCGDVIFLTSCRSLQVENCISNIHKMNQNACYVGIE
jgi:competence protein ComFA